MIKELSKPMILEIPKPMITEISPIPQNLTIVSQRASKAGCQNIIDEKMGIHNRYQKTNPSIIIFQYYFI